WSSELLAFDLPAAASATVSLFGGQHLVFRIQPAAEIEIMPGRTLAAAAAEVRMDWSPGSPMRWLGTVRNLSLTGDGSTVTVAQLSFPALAGFDVQNPTATAASFGIGIDRLESMLKALISSAGVRWGRVPAHVIAGLCGLHAALPDIPSGWPQLSDSSGPGSLLTDPLDALRQQLRALATTVAPDGTPFLIPALRWLAALFSDALPDQPVNSVAGFETLVEGSGS